MLPLSLSLSPSLLYLYFSLYSLSLSLSLSLFLSFPPSLPPSFLTPFPPPSLSLSLSLSVCLSLFVSLSRARGVSLPQERGTAEQVFFTWVVWSRSGSSSLVPEQTFTPPSPPPPNFPPPPLSTLPKTAHQEAVQGDRVLQLHCRLAQDPWAFRHATQPTLKKGVFFFALAPRSGRPEGLPPAHYRHTRRGSRMGFDTRSFFP